MNEFGAELKRLRLSRGMSLTAMEKAIHFTKGYLSKVENGKVRVNRKLAETCDTFFEAKGELVALADASTPRSSRPLVGLPKGTGKFVGRQDELRLLSSKLLGTTSPVLVLHGMAGVGKTGLAVRVAHEVAEYFPDGCLFFDLHGHTPETTALTSSEVMYRMLVLMEVPGDRIPPDVDGRANLLQDCLRDTRTLFVLDNVRDVRQLDRLIPDAEGCRTIVTSRRRLPTLDEAWHLLVGLLDEPDAVCLFGAVAAEHTPRDEDVVRAIVNQCGRLPLAVRIAAARFVHGGWSATDFRDRLSDEAGRLLALEDGAQSVAAAFALSYRTMPEPERRMFGLLALHPGNRAEIASVHALAGVGRAEADRRVDRLHDANLLNRDPDGHVELHDLVRAFSARHALSDIDSDDQDAAAERLVEHVLARVTAADELIEPYRYRPAGTGTSGERPFDGPQAALAWLRAEWPVVVEIVEVAASRRLHRACWQLAYVMRAFFYRDKHFDAWVRTHRAALAAAETSGDLKATGMILNNLGMAHLELSDVAGAAAYHEQAQARFALAGDERGRIDALSSRAWAVLYQGDPESAVRDLTTALAVYRRDERIRNVVIALRGIAIALTALDRFDEALVHAEQARSLAQLPLDVLMSVNCVAWIHFRAGRLNNAADFYQRAAEIAGLAEESDYEHARACTGLGNIAARRGDRRTAERWWSEADEHQVDLNPLTLGEAVIRSEEF
ncbi:transcriptional regulator [Actinophytocola xinjiangensis]|uniref:Transcriptional regulator n=1 Tax=Actinophytocola xinjiangensis TaxID=485602 RepID=A0A7Z1AYQ9_9PSEU|nr:helix-turn-helix domain-containing protein [Actinophytocola xinjiangensis]OLF10133.1 transcriptional regulator [Actinophytocola xinjiangensis]